MITSNVASLAATQEPVKATREINIGRVVGKSSYELAIEAGTFNGTLEEYNAREARLYSMFEQFEKDKKELKDIMNQIGRTTLGSWFEINQVTNADEMFTPITTYVNLDYVTDGLPDSLIRTKTVDELCMFVCKVSYLTDGTPAFITQELTQIVNGVEKIYRRSQLAEGNPSTEKWTHWIRIGY